MANYTPEEQRELNNDLKRVQDRLAKYINSDKWDIIVEQLSNSILDQICIINRAQTYRDVNWLVWQNMDDIVNTVSKMYNKPQCFVGRLMSNSCLGIKYNRDNTIRNKCRQCKWCKIDF